MYRREVMRTPLRALAAEIAISKSALDKFHKERSRPGKLWPKLRDWYMRTRATKREEYQTPPDLMIASVLQAVSQIPSFRRAAALRSTAAHFRELYTAPGEPLPEWVAMLGDIANQESEA